MTDSETLVWVAALRKGVDMHQIEPVVPGSEYAFTACKRCTRTGHTLPEREAVDRYSARYCKRCWPPCRGCCRQHGHKMDCCADRTDLE